MEWITQLKPEVFIYGGLTLVSLFLAWLFYKIVSNHINHNTEVLTKLCDNIDQNTDFTKEVIQLLKDLKK